MERLTRNVARVYASADVRAFDRCAIERLEIPGIRLMHRAGRAAFTALRERWPDAKRLSILCGGGNNGGDGYVVAGLAKDAGFEVQAIAAHPLEKLQGDALAAYRFATSRLGPIESAGEDWQPEGDVVVDALLGTGVQGALRPDMAVAAQRINEVAKPVLALDAPTGIDADTGGLLSPTPVRADATITFVAAKLGLVTGPALDYVGNLFLAPLDLPETVRESPGIKVLDGADLPRLQRRREAHKGDFGSLLVVGGEDNMGGAPLLAGEAALRTGAGTVTVATRSVHRAAILARRPELMVCAAEKAASLDDPIDRASAIVVGPGLGRAPWAKALLARCVAAGKPLVVDADGLNAVAAGDGIKALPEGAVITPHPGEAARLLGQDTAWVQSNRPQAAGQLASNGAVAVLKGGGTLIAADGAVQAVCRRGNPAMATAGSGDVLAGIIGALLARGFDSLAAAELGVWLHARAGDEAAATASAALLAGDIVAALRLTP